MNENSLKTIELIKDEMRKGIVGQEDMIEKVLIGLFTGGHILLEGVPGLAKSLTINTLSKILGLDFKRIQFTPDLLPCSFFFFFVMLSFVRVFFFAFFRYLICFPLHFSFFPIEVNFIVFSP